MKTEFNGELISGNAMLSFTDFEKVHESKYTIHVQSCNIGSTTVVV